MNLPSYFFMLFANQNTIYYIFLAEKLKIGKRIKLKFGKLVKQTVNFGIYFCYHIIQIDSVIYKIAVIYIYYKQFA